MCIAPALAARREFSGDEGSKFVYTANGFRSRQTSEHVREAEKHGGLHLCGADRLCSATQQGDRDLKLSCRKGKGSTSDFLISCNNSSSPFSLNLPMGTQAKGLFLEKPYTHIYTCVYVQLKIAKQTNSPAPFDMPPGKSSWC